MVAADRLADALAELLTKLGADRFLEEEPILIVRLMNSCAFRPAAARSPSNAEPSIPSSFRRRSSASGPRRSIAVVAAVTDHLIRRQREEGAVLLRLVWATPSFAFSTAFRTIRLPARERPRTFHVFHKRDQYRAKQSLAAAPEAHLRTGNLRRKGKQEDRGVRGNRRTG